MDYSFASVDKVRRFYDAPAGVELEARTYIERPGAVREGTPFFLGPNMRPVEPLCSFFFDLSKSLVATTVICTCQAQPQVIDSKYADM
ncbi:hypothetical protein OG887_44135 (plasmid) [Streptomyces sp. NBC_00053]|uniref:hypothetical protein n=1 Tax=unclassified Streptomyces TaxID=2593676 RepID=UPI000F5BB8D4|nr:MULTISPECIES: hypothetical protein [unclassified Streptomyces]MCX4400014.1 hypothetical protein [Streptomyces sp. NBC_01767]MCX5106876.1 hypothetical protein [Streptomyces sp. NBC_00439]MCX5505984.1 hypothetical protein [Streptomyces sp. NBC_00052]MCX5554016.1 hypothetical protein [Streptomyces sp. NBC_00051]MCX5554362.1 hypothetical protein [Streptomyces sp. NBC_00051]